MSTIEITIRAKAFTCEKSARPHKMIVNLADSSVRVWDCVAGYYTTCHRMSPKARQRALAIASIIAHA